LQEADDCKWPGGEPHGSFGQTADYDPNAPVPIIRGGQTRWVHPDNAKPYSLEEADRQLHNTAAAINEVREAMTQVRMAQIDLEHGLGNVYITRESGLEKVQRLRSWLADKRRMLQNSLEDLQAYAEEAGGEIKRLEMNIDKLRSGGARVKSARAKDELELGKVQLTRKLEQHQRMFEHLHKQMTLAWRTLRESSSIGSVQGGRS
jgi:DNA repair exonuclease SbcCD ATPase subunit